MHHCTLSDTLNSIVYTPSPSRYTRAEDKGETDKKRQEKAKESREKKVDGKGEKEKGERGRKRERRRGRTRGKPWVMSRNLYPLPSISRSVHHDERRRTVASRVESTANKQRARASETWRAITGLEKENKRDGKKRGRTGTREQKEMCQQKVRELQERQA